MSTSKPGSNAWYQDFDFEGKKYAVIVKSTFVTNDEAGQVQGRLTEAYLMSGVFRLQKALIRLPLVPTSENKDDVDVGWVNPTAQRGLTNLATEQIVALLSKPENERETTFLGGI